MRATFFIVSLIILALIVVGAHFWSPTLFALVVIGPLILLGVYDVLQTQHAVLRNFPIIGHGGILPGAKVSQEIARIRGVEAGKRVISPLAHSAFSTPEGLLQFTAYLRDLAGGKPVGFKLCVGNQQEFFAIGKAMLKTGILPDFITVDGAEGGTGALALPRYATMVKSFLMWNQEPFLVISYHPTTPRHGVRLGRKVFKGHTRNGNKRN